MRMEGRTPRDYIRVEGRAPRVVYEGGRKGLLHESYMRVEGRASNSRILVIVEVVIVL